MRDETATPPAGFIAFERRGPFTAHNGPFYHRPNPELTEHGFFVLARHCNGFGIAHGGLLASFLDGMLGQAVAYGTRARAVTIHLSLDYLSMARRGEWVQGEARITRQTRDVVFAEARAFVRQGGQAKDVVRASALFKRMDRRPAD